MTYHSSPLIDPQITDEALEWAIMHGVAIKNPDGSARHCPFSIAPMSLKRSVYQHLLKVTPLLTKLIDAVSEDHAFLRTALGQMGQADPFFGRLLQMHARIHQDEQHIARRQPLLIMRTDYMDDRQQGAKVIEFNGIAAGMGPFGQRATELHAFMQRQWPSTYQQWLESSNAAPAENQALTELAQAIATTAKTIHDSYQDKPRCQNQKHQQNQNQNQAKPTFLMVVQKNEDNVYDQHLLEVALQAQGIRTVRRTFQQLASQLYTGDGHRLMLKNVGHIDVVYLRAGYQFSDYCAPELMEPECCATLSQIRIFIEQHHVAVNATVSQQLATSKTMQMLLSQMTPEALTHWGLTLEEARLVQSVLAQMLPITTAQIHWFNSQANAQDWVLKNQGEGGGHCIFGEQISTKLAALKPQDYDAWALMQRLYPHERERPTIAVRQGEQSLIQDLVSEIGLFSVFFNGQPMTEHNGYAGYLVRSKPAKENEGGIHSGQGILDSITLIDA
ncbi:glutathione synthase [Vibrio stylophorae]|nr:glutathione synthase [Vibrio stylophorae]